MKRTINIKWAGIAFAAIAFVGLSQNAKALLSLPDPLAGGTQYTGAVQIHLSSLVEGASYSTSLAPGIYGSATNANTGVTALDALPGTTAPTGAQPTGSGLGNGLEDTFDVFRIDQILGSSGQTLYDKSTSPFQLAGLVYGGQDTALSVIGGGTQITSSVGIHVDLYQLAPGTFDLATALPTQHTSLTQFTNLTIGSPILTTTAQAGLFGAQTVLNPGGALTELSDTFNVTTLTGNGNAYLNVTGGTDATQFNTNTQLGGTDLAAAFQLSPLFAQYHAPWTTADSDPISASVIPEPSTVLAGIASLLPIMAGVFRRRSHKGTA